MIADLQDVVHIRCRRHAPRFDAIGTQRVRFEKAEPDAAPVGTVALLCGGAALLVVGSDARAAVALRWFVDRWTDRHWTDVVDRRRWRAEGKLCEHGH